jgi:putative transcriptional regulator
MTDANFSDTVVLVTNHQGPGVVGVILNRPTEVELSKLLEGIPKVKGRRDKVYAGGPVMTQVLHMVFRAPTKPENAVELLEGVYMSTSRSLFQELLERDIPIDDLRVFAGYAGWGSGQLEREISEGAWHLARADVRTIFSKNPAGMWKTLELRAAQKSTSR